MLFLVLLFISGVCYADSDPVTNNTFVFQIIRALFTLLNFTEKYLDSMNLDGLFGMSLAEANLHQILNSPIHPIIKATIKMLQQELSGIKLQGQNFVEKVFQNGPYAETYQKMTILLDWEFWVRLNVTFKDNQLTRLPPQWSDDYFSDGFPNETVSDFCLTEILKLGIDKVKHCPVHDICKKVYFDTESSHGYPLTHKLLYWSVFNRAKCIDQYDSKKIQKRLCSRILSEAEGIMAIKPFFRPLGDLFMEQADLCGMEGYSEFYQKIYWLQMILSWQNVYGCFESFRPHDSVLNEMYHNRRRKRSSTMMAHGCENHITGLAFSYLTFNLKYLLEINNQIDL